jgi:anaerobic selenocysteine-containing dehydrogenase
VIDPIETRTARAADWHVRLRPGTDAALAMGMMQIIVSEALHDADYVARHTIGFDRLRERLADYPVERVAQITGIPDHEILSLARAYATSRPSLIRILVGMEHHRRGGTTVRTVACLPAITGAWRDRGGGLLFLNWEAHYRALPIAQVHRPEATDMSVRAFHQSQLSTALDPALDPPIRALFVFAANPAVSVPNQHRLRAHLAREDLFTVVHEQFVTETAKFADYVIPATTQLEHVDVHHSWGHPYVTYNNQAIAPRGDALSISELFRRLATRLGLDESWLHESDDQIAADVLRSDHPWAASVQVERLREEGWVRLAIPDDFRPYAEGEFPTPSGKCELYSETLEKIGVDPLPGYVSQGDPELTADGASYPLQLITPRRNLRMLNTSYSHVARALDREGPPVLEIHPADAAERGIAEGMLVRVFNARGAVEVPARVDPVVMQGVVALPFGWWGDRLLVNVLTSDGLSDIGGGADFHGTRVDVAAVR